MAEIVTNQERSRRISVGVAEPRGSGAKNFYDDDCGRIPFEGSVGTRARPLESCRL